jgi:methionyl-tRNA synthetase
MGSDYSAASLSTSYRHLSDQIGNLLQRISSPKLLLAVGDFRQQDRDAELDGLMSGLRDTVDTKMATYEITAVCQTVMELVMAVSLRLRVVHRHDDPLSS